MEHMDITVPKTAVFIVYMIICVTNKLVVVTGVVTQDILIVTVKKVKPQITSMYTLL